MLLDDVTFKCVKDSLSVLGTVTDNGYNDRQLQQLLQAQAMCKVTNNACPRFGK